MPQRHSQSAVSQTQLLQRRIGNQALLRLLAQRGSVTRNEPGAPENAARLPGAIQVKLKVGGVNDPLEREADSVAEQVMRMPAPEVTLTSAPPKISRKCAECEEEEKLQKKPAGTAEAAAGEAPAIVHEVLRSPGQPLDASTRAYFEPRFGYDFSSVGVHARPPDAAGSGLAVGSAVDHYEQEADRLADVVTRTPRPGMSSDSTRRQAYDFKRVRGHTDALADESARAPRADAYTTGHHIVFAGRYALQTPGGRRLLAHELTHTVQQGAGAHNSVQKQDAAPPTETSETAISVFPFAKGSKVALSKLFPDKLFDFASNNISNWVKGIQDQDLTVTEASADRFQAAFSAPAKPQAFPGSTLGPDIPNISITVDRIGSGRFEIKIISGTKLLTLQETRATRKYTLAIILSPVASKPQPLPGAGKPLSPADEYAKSAAAPLRQVEPEKPREQPTQFPAQELRFMASDRAFAKAKRTKD